MARSKRTDSPKLPLVLIALIAVQVFCAAVFLGDLLADSQIPEMSASDRLDLYIEAAASLGLVAGIVFEVRYLLDLLRRKTHLEDSLRAANAAVFDVIAAEFDSWSLTPSERDVATFLVKGMSIAEIAALGAEFADNRLVELLLSEAAVFDDFFLCHWRLRCCCSGRGGFYRGLRIFDIRGVCCLPGTRGGTGGENRA